MRHCLRIALPISVIQLIRYTICSTATNRKVIVTLSTQNTKVNKICICSNNHVNLVHKMSHMKMTSPMISPISRLIYSYLLKRGTNVMYLHLKELLKQNHLHLQLRISHQRFTMKTLLNTQHFNVMGRTTFTLSRST